MTQTRFALYSVALAAVALLSAAALEAGAAESANLTGTWRLNRGQSGAPGAQPQAGDPGEPRGRGGRGPGAGGGMAGGRRGGMGRGGMGRGGAMGPGGRQRPSEEELTRTRELMREVLEPESSFTIARSDTTVTFVFPDGRTRTYAANDKGEKHQLTAGTVETKAKWDGGQFVVRTKVSDRISVVQTYLRHAEEPRLTVTSRLNGAFEGRTVTHVYELAERSDP